MHGEVAGALAGTERRPSSAAYLTHFRADEIVNDCELVREALGAERWTVLGQSFGGFTTLHYLSTHAARSRVRSSPGASSAVRHPIDDIYSADLADHDRQVRGLLPLVPRRP